MKTDTSGAGHHYAVGMTVKGQSEHMTVDAEDALAAALKAKEAFPEALITYVRKRNNRGDLRRAG